MASLALASLTETYTDSEGEESAPKESLEKSREVSPVLVSKSQEIPVTKTIKPTRLVSYHGHDDTVVSDDDHHDIEGDVVMVESPTVANPPTMPVKPPVVFTDVDMPSEPTGPCSNELTEKILEMTKKMNDKGYDMNLIIQKRKTFRNPSIYEKLIDFCNINEFGTNYEPQIYDPLKWDKTSYYDELAKLQKADMEQREKERRERTKIEFLTGTAKKVANGTTSTTTTEDETKKRKSKWDQVVYPGPVATRVQTTVTTLTTTATGTKGTIISAFGSLPKKPKS